MMKKEYINPELEIMQIDVCQHMLAGSLEKVDSDPDEWGAPEMGELDWPLNDVLKF